MLKGREIVKIKYISNLKSLGSLDPSRIRQFLQRGGGCCKKSEQKVKENNIMEKNRPQISFFQWKRVFRSEIT